MDEKKAKAEVERITRDLSEVAAARAKLELERTKLDEDLAEASPSDEGALKKILDRQRELGERDQLLARRAELTTASLKKAQAQLGDLTARGLEAAAAGLRASLKRVEGEVREAANQANALLTEKILQVRKVAEQLGGIEAQISAARGGLPEGPTASVLGSIALEGSPMAALAGVASVVGREAYSQSLRGP